MKRLIDAIIKKWFCCHEWKEIGRRNVVVEHDFGESRYTVIHYV